MDKRDGPSHDNADLDLASGAIAALDAGRETVREHFPSARTSFSVPPQHSPGEEPDEQHPQDGDSPGADGQWLRTLPAPTNSGIAVHDHSAGRQVSWRAEPTIAPPRFAAGGANPADHISLARIVSRIPSESPEILT